MTSPKAGNEETRIQNREAATLQQNFIRLAILGQGLSLLLGVGLTLFLAYKDHDGDALCGFALRWRRPRATA